MEDIRNKTRLLFSESLHRLDRHFGSMGEGEEGRGLGWV